MKVSDVISELEKLAPTDYAEGFDNVGLLLGDKDAAVKKILVTHDTLEAVVDEAVQKGANLIVSFHPIIFSGLKSLTGKNYVERTVMKAIKNEIAVYAIHTAYDNSRYGVNHIISNHLDLKNSKILIPQKGTLEQLVTYVPDEHAEKVRNALFQAGAGNIGNYDSCTFNIQGKGSFRAKEGANPFVGTVGEVHYENETRISAVFEKHRRGKILKALRENHPYEEVAYEIIALENADKNIGMGMIGDLEEEMSGKEFLKFLKERMKAESVRHSQILDKPIKRVAVLGGSGSFAIEAALAAGADAYVTADLKYHDFYRAEGRILLADIGHYESERYTKVGLTSYLSEKFPNFAILKSEINTNPVHYA